MIQYEYRQVNPTTTLIMPSSDTVCPRCRHVFSVSSPTSPTLTKFSNLCNEQNSITTNLAKHTAAASHDNDNKLLEKEIPPTPPPRLKPPSTTYANLPPSSSSSATSSNTTSTNSSKSYVTMSNLNLNPNPNHNSANIVLVTSSSINSNNNNNNNNYNVQPTFMPVDESPSRTEMNPISLFASASTNSSHSIQRPTLLSSSSFCTATTTTSTSTPSSTNIASTSTSLNSSSGRVYRQLSGGGLIDTSNNNFLRIHELQPMHQMCGGGLINTRAGVDDSPFLLNESSRSKSTSLSLPLQNCDLTKQTNTISSSTAAGATSISIYPSSSNISIVVPPSVHTSLEISPNTINIKLPRPVSLASERLFSNDPSSSSTSNCSHNNTFSLFNSPEHHFQMRRPTTIPPIPPIITSPRMLFPSPAVAPLTTPLNQHHTLQRNKPAPIVPVVDDMQCLTRTVHCLKESGWFHEGLSWNESENLLQGSANGTFIVRESSNPNFLYAITVQTEQEPTSVRIQYDNGHFRLDCVSHVTPIVPQFDCVVDLIEYYVTKHNQYHYGVDDDKNPTRNSSQHVRGGGGSGCSNSTMRSSAKTAAVDIFPGNQVFVDENGYINSVVSLRHPLRSAVPSLMHCARLSINKQLKTRDNYSKCELSQILDQLELPKSLKTYLFKYPYSL